VKPEREERNAFGGQAGGDKTGSRGTAITWRERIPYGEHAGGKEDYQDGSWRGKAGRRGGRCDESESKKQTKG